MHKVTWTVAEAQEHLPELIAEAAGGLPQEIALDDHHGVVVVPAHVWDRLVAKAGTLTDFFLYSPLRGSGIDLERDRHGKPDTASE